MVNRPVRITVENAREFRRVVKKVGGKEAQKALKDGHKEAARIVADSSKKSHVPVRSGTLQKSIRPQGTQREAKVAAGRARIPYAGVIHYGWPRRNIKATNFLTDAVADRLGTVRDEIERLYLKIAKDLESRGR